LFDQSDRLGGKSVTQGEPKIKLVKFLPRETLKSQEKTKKKKHREYTFISKDRVSFLNSDKGGTL